MTSHSSVQGIEAQTQILLHLKLQLDSEENGLTGVNEVGISRRMGFRSKEPNQT
jgi:hypothetical protein